MKKFRIAAAILAATIMGLISAFCASTASAASTVNPSEGHGGNSVVCGGVKSHAALVALAKGAPDMCGHIDVAHTWAMFGITPQVATKMHSGVVCGNGGWTSFGRQHGPIASKDVRAGHGFKRPLSVWGKGVCYDAWIGTLEDGTQVAVLKGCGNPEMRKGHRPAPVTPAKPKTPVATPSGSCNVTITGTVNGNVINCSTFTNTVTCGNLSQTFTGSSSTDVASQAQKWQQANCVTNTPPPLTCQTQGATNIGGSLPCQFPPPTPTCQTSGATNIGGALPCQFPPPVVVTFTMSFDTINDIPAGTCRPEILHVTSSVAGQVKISPNAGLISTIDCYQPTTGQLSQVTLSVSTGSHDLTVYVYEPNDSSLNSDTLTAVPLITGVDARSNTATTPFTVSHPTRP